MAIARPKITEEEFMRLPTDGRKFELVDGEVREVPTSFEHDQIVIHLARRMGPHVPLDRASRSSGTSAG